MSVKAQAARGIKWQALELLSRQLISFGIFWAMARLLEPSDFGLAGLVMVYLSFTGLFLDQGIGTSLVQRKDLDAEHINAAFWFSAIYASVLFVLTNVFAEWIASYFSEPRLANLLRVSSIGLLLGSTATVHYAQFVREMDFRRPMVRTVVANITGGVVGLGLAWAGAGVWSLIGQQLTASVTSTAFLWAASTWRPSLRFSGIHLRQLMFVSVSIFGSVLLWFFCSRFDQIVVGRYFGAKLLGEYVIGIKLTEIARLLVNQPITSVSISALSRLQGDKPRMCQSIYKGMELNALLAFAAFGGLAAASDDLIIFLFGDRWALAANITAILSLYTLVIALVVFSYPAMLASGDAGNYVIVNMIYLVGVTIACLIGAQYGVLEIAWGLLANSIVMILPMFIFLNRRLGLDARLYFKPCLIPGIAAIFMGAAVHLVRLGIGDSLILAIRLALEILAGAITYIAIVMLLNPTSLGNFLAILRHSLGIQSNSTAKIETNGDVPN